MYNGGIKCLTSLLTNEDPVEYKLIFLKDLMVG